MASLADVLQANAGKTVVVTNNMKDYTGEIIGLREPDAIATLGHLACCFRRRVHRGRSHRSAGRKAAVPSAARRQETRRSAAFFHYQHGSSRRHQLPRENRAATCRSSLQHQELRRQNQSHRWLSGTRSRLDAFLLISLTDDRTAQITMQAVVMADAEDLKDTDVFFVVGVLNFAYSNTPSLVSLQQNLLAFMQDAERSDSGGFVLIPTPSAVKWSLWRRIGAVIPALLRSRTITELSGAPEEALFLYRR
jgi:hypothetical protein